MNKQLSIRIPMLAAALALGLASSSSALAKEGDIEACEGLAVGDACTRLDGDPGVCQPDASDPNVIKCDDDGLGAGNSGNSGAGNSGSSDDSGGSSSSDDGGGIDCSASGGSGAPGAAFGLAVFGAFLAWRRANVR